LSYRRNEVRTHAIDLSRALAGKRTGIALVALDSPELDRPHWWPRRALAQVTDLAVHLKMAPAQSPAWVTPLSTGQSVGGAAGSGDDGRGRLLWMGKS